MGSGDDRHRRDRWARLRFAIIGPLLAAPPAPGDLQAALSALAARSWRHPLTGLEVRFGASTIERWYYAARHAADPVAVLRNQVRRDIGGFPSVGLQTQEALRSQYAAHPGWTAQLHHDNLRVLLAAFDPVVPCPSYASVRRYLKAQGLTRKRPARYGDPVIPGTGAGLVEREIRSYEVEYVLQLMHLDFHHGSRKVLSRAGAWIKPLLVAFIDDRSRYLCHAQWYAAEGTEQLVHGFSQALSKVGLPRSLMSDRGSAMMSGEFTAGLERLGILHVPTLPRSPHVNGKQENLWTRVEGRLLAMLEGEERLTLDQLNLATCAWVTQEYQRTVHREIGVTPLERYLAGPSVARACPGSDELRAAFRIEVKRRVRRSDGTASLEGHRFEIPSRYRHLPDVHLRYARWDLRRVDLIDPRLGTILCPVYPIDKAANAERLRRTVEPASHAPTPGASGIAPLLKQMIADYAATGLPPAYLPDSHPKDDPA
ncbi:MAG: DDE-type integrase/transposase/recombinase [Gammaproteobacteria bacterium]|nr:DDE-type integrase/transposase/recombinase [Gammaproteobacteria bacterium]